MTYKIELQDKFYFANKVCFGLRITWPEKNRSPYRYILSCRLRSNKGYIKKYDWFIDHKELYLWEQDALPEFRQDNASDYRHAWVGSVQFLLTESENLAVNKLFYETSWVRWAIPDFEKSMTPAIHHLIAKQKKIKEQKYKYSNKDQHQRCVDSVDKGLLNVLTQSPIAALKSARNFFAQPAKVTSELPPINEVSFPSPEKVHIPPWYLDQQNIGSYPDDFEWTHNRIRKWFTKQLDAHTNLFQKLGIPTPTIEKPTQWKPLFTVDEQKRKYELTGYEEEFTQFAIPHHRTFSIRPLIDIDSVEFLPAKQQTTYFIVGDVDILARADKVYAEHGLIGVVKDFNGTWFNCDPYALYKYLNQHKTLMLAFTMKPDTYGGNFDDFSSALYKWTDVALKTMPGYTLAELEQFQRNARLLAGQAVYECLRPGLEDFSERGTYGYVRRFGYKEHRRYGTDLFDLRLAFPLPPATYYQAYSTYKLIMPQTGTAASLMSHFWESLHQLSNPIIFEIVYTQNLIYFQLSYAPQDAVLINRQLELYFPEAEAVSLAPDLAHPHSEQPLYTATVCPQPNYAEKEDPLFTIPAKSDRDPYQQLCNVLAKLNPSDRVHFQFMCFPLSPDAEQLLYSTPSGSGEYFEWHKYRTGKMKKYSDGSEYEETTSEAEPLFKHRPRFYHKLSSWMLGARITTSRPAIIETIKDSFLATFENKSQQWDIGTPEATLDTQPRLTVWNVVSMDEFTALVHLPTAGVISDLLETTAMKSSLPPDDYSTNGIVIGTAAVRGANKAITIPPNVRDRHLYVVGKSGVGKSTLIFNAARQDIEQGYGVCVVDPHGDLVEDLLNHIPSSRIEDTIYFDAADRKNPIPLNILNVKDEDEIAILADDLIVMFRRLSETWGVQLENILRYTFNTLLRVPNTTFLDIQNILQDDDFRNRLLSHIDFPPLLQFWERDFPNFRKDSIHPILNRMSKFVLSPILYGILGKAESYLNFYDVIQSKKILLVNLSQGKIGEDTCKLLGSVIVSQLQLNIMRRANIPKEQRHPYMLYVDEFQNFTSSAFEKILSEARKYKLCLNLAHQYTSQLDDSTRHAILSNVGTFVLFELGASDANALRGQIGKYEPTDIMNLSSKNHEALCKPATQAKDTFKFTTAPPPPIGQSFAREIIEHTKNNYCTGAAMTPLVEEAAATAPLPTPPSSPAATEAHTGSQPRLASEQHRKRPALTTVKNFGNVRDKILYFIEQAGFLSNSQIVTLCYSHLENPNSKAAAASRDLKKLLDEKKIKVENNGKSRIYFIGRTPNAPAHNLAVRDLFVKIVCSDFEIAKVDFTSQLGGLNPDLELQFLADDGGFIKSYWEYDTGTENVSELVKKVERYKRLGKEDKLCFVFATRERLEQVQKTIKDDWIIFGVLEEFTSLNDMVFSRAGDNKTNNFFGV